MKLVKLKLKENDAFVIWRYFNKQFKRFTKSFLIFLDKHFFIIKLHSFETWYQIYNLLSNLKVGSNLTQRSRLSLIPHYLTHIHIQISRVMKAWFCKSSLLRLEIKLDDSNIQSCRLLLETHAFTTLNIFVFMCVCVNG